MNPTDPTLTRVGGQTGTNATTMQTGGGNGGTSLTVILLVAPLALVSMATVSLVLIGACCFYWRRKSRRYKTGTESTFMVKFA